MIKQDRKTHLYGLDILRIIAATLVLLNHYAMFGWREADGFARGADAAFPILAPFASTGAIGVQIFFVISGFVISMSASGTQPLDFAKHRFIRLAPVLWLCATIALTARLLSGEPVMDLVGEYLRSVVLAPKGPYIDGVIWSLAVEAVFYGVIFLALTTKGFVSLEKIAAALMLGSAVFLSVFFVTTYFPSTRFPEMSGYMSGFVYKVALLRHGVFFALGMFVYSVVTFGGARWKYYSIALCTIFGLVEILLSMAGRPLVGIASCVIWMAALGGIVASVLFAIKIEKMLGERIRFVRSLGQLSYPLYLNHYAVGIVMVPALFGAGLSAPWAMAIGMSYSVGSSWFIMKVPEKMAHRWLKNLLFAPGRRAKTQSRGHPA